MMGFFGRGKAAPIDKKKIESLESEQQEMIRGVVELSDTTVKEVMVPRTDTVFLDAADGKDEILSRLAESEHSRFPVYEDTIDNVIGVLHVKDVLRHLVKNGIEAAFDIRALLRKPFFVPDSKHIDDLLREMRRRRNHVAVVVDEYGGVSGIVCMEDIIEEIVGDIQDEFDHETEDIVKLAEGVWLCDARVNLDDLAEGTGLLLQSEDVDTLGGFVFNLFGKIPVRHEKATWENLDFIIHDMDGHKINTVKIVARNKDESHG